MFASEIRNALLTAGIAVAIAAGTLLPYLASRDRRLLAPETTEKGDHEHDNDIDAEDAELDKIREMVREWKLEAAREGKALRLPTMPFMLRNIWSSAMALFFVLMVSTFFVDKVWQVSRLPYPDRHAVDTPGSGYRCHRLGWYLLGRGMLGVGLDLGRRRRFCSRSYNSKDLSRSSWR